MKHLVVRLAGAIVLMMGEVAVASSTDDPGQRRLSVEHEAKRFNFRLNSGFGDMNKPMIAAYL